MCLHPCCRHRRTPQGLYAGLCGSPNQGRLTSCRPSRLVLDRHFYLLSCKDSTMTRLLFFVTLRRALTRFHTCRLCQLLWIPPPAISIYVLHFFSGRRRLGDCHAFFMQEALPQGYRFVCRSTLGPCGGLSGPLGLTGPPCETFCCQKPLRSAQALWGIPDR